MPSTVTGLKTLLGRFGYAVRERQDGDGVLQRAKMGSASPGSAALRAFPHRVESQEPTDVPSTVTGLKTLLGRFGYAVRERQDGDGVLAAKKAAPTAWVWFARGHGHHLHRRAARQRIAVRLQVMFGGKKPIVENMLISEVPESGRLSVNNPSFRASVCPRTARPPPPWVGDGALVQPMPFTLKLKKFVVDILHRHAQPLRQRSGGHRSRHRQELRVHHRGQ